MVVQPKWDTPMKLNGKTHAEPSAGPEVAIQVVLSLLEKYGKVERQEEKVY